MGKSKDLFDDSTMSFGEHLEELRTRVIKALIGLVIGVIIALFFGQELVAVVRSPIDAALARHGVQGEGEEEVAFDVGEWFRSWWSDEEPAAEPEPAAENAAEMDLPEESPDAVDVDPLLITAEARVKDSKENRERLGETGKSLIGQPLEVTIRAREFAQLRRAIVDIDKPKTFNVQEAFLTYLKVSLIFGLVGSSWWVLYQAWQFVAAGLYPHERRYVYVYLPMSVFLFLGGAIFCFFFVFPFILDFLLRFNTLLGVQPQIRLSEWISFAVMLPVMFGVSFQLPLVMLFLERISVFEAKQYRENRKMAIVVIAILSMMLSPPDPMSMIFMLVPLVALYELGIVLCERARKQETPFEQLPA